MAGPTAARQGQREPDGGVPEGRRAVREQQAARVRDQGFVAALDQSGGSTPKALREYGITDDQYADPAQMFDWCTRCEPASSRVRASAATASWAPSCSSRPWIGRSAGCEPLSSCGARRGSCPSQDRPRPGGRSRRRPADEGHRRVGRPARKSDRQRHLRHENALAHHLGQPARDPQRPGSAARLRGARPGGWSGADPRARDGHRHPGQAAGRGHASQRSPRTARCAARGRDRDAQGHAAAHGRPLPAVARSSARAAGPGPVWRLPARPRVRTAVAQSRRHRQLLSRVHRGLSYQPSAEEFHAQPDTSITAIYAASA